MRRLPATLAAAALVASLAGAVIHLVIETPYGASPTSDVSVDTAFALLIAFAGVANTVTGAVVASRVPSNSVGWIVLLLGLGIGLVLLAAGYGDLGRVRAAGPLPGDDVAAWVGDVCSIPVLFGLPAFLLLLFPDGHLLTPRWRPFAYWLAALITTSTLSYGLSVKEIGSTTNPFAVDGPVGRILEWVSEASDVLGVPTLLTCAVAVALRLRRSRGLERQQLKGFAFMAALAGTALGATLLGGGRFSAIAFGLGMLGMAAMPVAAGLAVLRYRLFDIDVVIKRTITYAVLTAFLVGTYFGSVLLLAPVFGESDLAVATSTLAVAALFRPLHSRVQELVNRRFFRSRYDATLTLDAFSERLRHELDLETLGTDLSGVVRDTMQPAHVSIWLRSPS